MVGLENPGQSAGEQTLVEHWTGGPNWTAVPTSSLPGGALDAVSAVSPTDIWAVGLQNPGLTSEGLAAHWDGTSWTRVAVPGGSFGLGAVAAVSASNVWAGGATAFTGGSAVLLHYDGSSWTPSPVPALTPSPGPGQVQGASINGLAAISATDAWAVGAVELSHQDFPLILHWDGTSWSQFPPLRTPRPELT